MGTSTVFAYVWPLPVACNVMLDLMLDSFTIAMMDYDDEKNNNDNGKDQNNSQYSKAESKQGKVQGCHDARRILKEGFCGMRSRLLWDEKY
jgi:hypothetical protein